MSLELDRERAAQVEFEAYDFGGDKIEAFEGWERTMPGNTWTRTIYVAASGDSIRGTFVVVFAEEATW